MLLRKVLPALWLCFGMPSLYGQKKIVLEELRFAAPINYLRQEKTQQQFVAGLNAALRRYHLPLLSDTTKLPVVNAGEDAKRLSLKPVYNDNDTNTLHMTMNVVEFRSGVFFENGGVVTTDSVWNATRTVFKLQVRITDHMNKNVVSKDIAVLVGNTKDAGLGHTPPHVFVSPASFTEAMTIGFSNLLDPYGADYVFVAVAPAYAADNYVLPLVTEKHKIPVNTSNYISTYTYQNTKQVLRYSGPVYEKILLGGKTEGSYPEDLSFAVKHAAGYRSSDFVFFKQERRDVINNRNYLLALVMEVNYNLLPANRQGPYKTALPGYFHVLLLDRDTIARFQINKDIIDRERFIYPNRIYDGIDTASAIDLGPKTAIPVQYAYIVDGEIDQKKFRIRCSNLYGRLREFYIDGRVVCIAQGGLVPETVVVLDETLSADLLNRLLFLGFNAFFAD